MAPPSTVTTAALSGNKEAVGKKELSAKVEKTEEMTLSIDGVSYDISNFLSTHPGGEIIKSYVGRDATDVFYAFHSSESKKWLHTLPKSTKQDRASLSPELLHDFRQLRASFERRGLLDASSLWYLYKTLSTLLIGAIGIYLGLIGWIWTGALVLGLCWQQMGWLAHELCHHCWFKDRKLGYKVTIMLGNMLQGFDTCWWSDRHNQHHAVPNVLGGHEAGGDPDIDNLPVVAWDERDLARIVDWPSWAKRLIQWQGYYFVFVMPLLRFIWAFQSLLFLKTMPTSPNPQYRRNANLSKYTLSFFWLWSAIMILCMPTLLSGLLFFVVANLVGGAGIAFVVFFNHHSLDKVAGNDAVDNFVSVQILTTRNMKPSVFVDWLWGGLNYQIEHHLFPTAPRHNLSKLAPEVKALLAKHNLPYYTDTFVSGLSQMCRHLTEVAGKLGEYEKKLGKSA